MNVYGRSAARLHFFVTKGATRRDTLMATERLAVSRSPRRSMRARLGRRLLIAPTSNLMM